MKCDLSGFHVTILDSILFENGIRISAQLIELWIRIVQRPVCPMTGKSWTPLDLETIARTITSRPSTRAILNAFQVPKDSIEVFSKTQLAQLRQGFWNSCLNELVQETLDDNYSMAELQQFTKLLFQGSIRECPLQTMNQFVKIYSTLNFVTQPTVETASHPFFLEAVSLRTFVRVTMHRMMTLTRNEVLQRILEEDGFPILDPPQQHLIHALLITSLMDDTIELFGQ